jgi:hypothetical protein
MGFYALDRAEYDALTLEEHKAMVAYRDEVLKEQARGG